MNTLINVYSEQVESFTMGIQLYVQACIVFWLSLFRRLPPKLSNRSGIVPENFKGITAVGPPRIFTVFRYARLLSICTNMYTEFNHSRRICQGPLI